MNTKLKNNFLILFSSSFPGGFKALAVFSIVFLFSDDFVKEFNHLYFLSLLNASIAVIPFSSLMASKRFSFSLLGCFFWVFLLNMLCSFSIFVSGYLVDSFTLLDFLFFSMASLFFGGYEVARRALSNNHKLIRIFISGVLSVCLLCLFFILPDWFSNRPLVLLFYISMCFGLPIMLILLSLNLNGNILGGSSFKFFLEKLLSACLSNATSSLLSFVIPLFIINLLGTQASPYLGVIFSSVSIFLLLPRYLSEKDIPKLRNSNQPILIANHSFKVIANYLVFVMFLAFLCFYIVQISNIYLYFLLFISLLISQITLPYSNILMVSGAFKLLLFANVVGVSPFLLYLIAKGVSLDVLYQCYFIIVLYILSSLLKFLLTKKYCAKIDFI